MLTRKRFVALALGFLLAASVAFAPSASAGTVFVDIPSGGLLSQVVYTSPNPSHSVVQMGVWYTVQVSSCVQKVKVGNYAGYAFGQIAYVSGTCDFGGVEVTYLVNGQTFPTTNPFWQDNGTKRVCAAGDGAAWFCTQLGDGSLWNQPQQNYPPNYTGTSVIGINVALCQYRADGALCSRWWLTVF